MADAAGRAFNGRAADNDAVDTSCFCCLLEDLAAARDRAVRDCRRCEIDSILYIEWIYYSSLLLGGISNGSSVGSVI